MALTKKKPSRIAKARELGAEIMAGANWDQCLFPTETSMREMIAWLKAHNLPYQVVGEVDGKYRVRVR